MSDRNLHITLTAKDEATPVLAAAWREMVRLRLRLWMRKHRPTQGD